LTLGGLGDSGGTCFPVDFPSGKALVIKSIFADISFPATASLVTFWSLRKGTTCSGSDLIADHPPAVFGGKTIEFAPGLAVPAGGLSLWIKTAGGQLGVATYIYGSWVSASTVP